MKHRGSWLRLFRHIVTFPQRIKRLEAQVEDLRDTLAIRQESIEWQADVISEMKFQKASLKRELMQVQDENRGLRDEWHEARSKIKSLDEEIQQLKVEK